MLTSYSVTCPHGKCEWSGNLIPAHVRGGNDAEIASAPRAWFRCPRCQRDWEVRIEDERVTILPLQGD
jgi:hypothetical protein